MKPYRVEICDGDKVVISGWGKMKNDSCVMDNEYEVKPEVGMTLTCRLGKYQIVSVEKNTLKLKMEV